MEKVWTLGVCARDSKARSKPMSNILDRMISTGKFTVLIFGDNVLLNEPIEDWPKCDFLISFFSSGFPIVKAIEYVNLRRPICINNLPLQQLLLDRRIVLEILDFIKVPTPKRLVTWNRDVPIFHRSVKQGVKRIGLDLEPYSRLVATATMPDRESVQVGQLVIKKPFVEKPVNSEDHNIYIYMDEQSGGGVRKLFRKKGNKSSEYVAEEYVIRQGSYLYEEFMSVDNAEDVKVYTIGPDCVHAETRKSPVVDGIVRRNAEGKEIRYVTELSPEEKEIARKVCETFGQTICGFDLLRVNGRSYVIDINGWSFVKGNQEYYDKCAEKIAKILLDEANRRGNSWKRQQFAFSSQWKLKAFMSVMRHGDRTPKQKAKFLFTADVFLDLVRESEDELIMKSMEKFKVVIAAVKSAQERGLEDPKQLSHFLAILESKALLGGTKLQMRPILDKTTKQLQKVQLIVKWGGRFTHSGKIQATDLGQNLRKDLGIINKDVLDDVKVISSSEIRVTQTAEVFCRAFLDTENLDPKLITISREMLDDSNAAKEQSDITKVKLQKILNPEVHTAPPSVFVMPDGWVDLADPVQELINLLKQLRELMHENLKIEKETTWCCYETPQLFLERWEKLFREFCDIERNQFEPSKVSELYDALKFDLLHNREYLNYSFYHPTENLTKKLCTISKAIFDIIGPHEYGIENEEKLEIGSKNVQLLLRNIVEELHAAKESDTPFTRLYFTKESKVYSLLNVVLLSGIKTNYKPTDIQELDYLTQITFELYEKQGSFYNNRTLTDYALRIGFSPGNLNQ